MKSLQSLSGQIHINEPLPWDVRDNRGQVLLRKGHVVTDSRQFETLIERGVYVEREEFERYKRESAPPPHEQFDPFWRWDAVFGRLGRNLVEQITDPEFVADISRIAEDIDQLTERDANAGIFAMFRLDPSNYPVAHSLRTACFSGIVARALSMTETQRLTLLKAALTMNIAMIELQNTLYRQSEPPTELQYVGIKSHPIRGRQRLEELGVQDEEWLCAVAEHHETPDGKGYPAGLTTRSPLAEIIYHTDMYCAMTSGRVYRKPLPPNVVARKLYLAADSQTPVPMLLIKKLGIHPPGSFVSLANGEVAIVTRSGQSAKSPEVYSLQGRQVYVEPFRRDTAMAEYSIVDSVDPEAVMFQINPLKLFGYDK